MPSTAASPTDALTDTPPAAPMTVLTRNRYDAFVSYSHAKDKAVASALQSVVQRLGKAWHQRRAVRLFRDDSSLTATPHLWPAIETALGNSRFLVLLASPEAAASAWVDKEVAWWLDRNSAETILIGLTAGELDWDGTAGDFRPTDEFPLPSALKGRFIDEPLWIDLRAYRDAVNRSDPDFANLAAGIAAALHGIPKKIYCRRKCASSVAPCSWRGRGWRRWSCCWGLPAGSGGSPKYNEPPPTPSAPEPNMQSRRRPRLPMGWSST
jgi:hypothetical protein